MIRVILYLIVIVLLAFGAVWLAERPGEVAITWQGRRLDTSVMVLIAAAVALAGGGAPPRAVLPGGPRAPRAGGAAWGPRPGGAGGFPAGGGGWGAAPGGAGPGE